MKKKELVMKLLKIILGIIGGLTCAFATIVSLEIILPNPNPFRKETVNLWLIAPIITAWLFMFLWLLLRKPSACKNILTRNIEDLPDNLSELIDAIIQTMRFRKSDRADVRQELTDHFTDALSHCQDEQEKKTQIAELAAEFGDPELLGALIRRGKKRCQPLWRKVLTHTPLAIGISILLLIVYIGWFITGKPQPSIDYLAIWNEQIRPTVDDSANAAPFYSKAAEIYNVDALLAWKDKYEKTFDKTPKNLTTLSTEERDTLDKWLNANTESLELIKQGAQKPYYWQTYSTGQEDSTELIAILLPHLADFKDLCRLLCWQALIDAQQGNYQQAFDTCFTTYTFGTHIRDRHKTLIEQLIGMAFQRITNNTIRTILNDHVDQIDATLLTNTKQRLARLIEKQTFTVDYSGEILFLYDEIQRCFTISRFGKSHLYLRRLSELGGDQEIYENEHLIKNAAVILFTHPDKEETQKTFETFYDTMEIFINQTPATQQASENNLDKAVDEIIEGNIFLEIMLPALGKCIEISYRNQVGSQAMLVIFATLDYKKTHNQYPESLQALVDSGHLKTIPIDPFSNKPLIYRKTEQSFTLYSVGMDLTDNGGIPGKDNKGNFKLWDDTNDTVFWPINGSEK